MVKRYELADQLMLLISMPQTYKLEEQQVLQRAHPCNKLTPWWWDILEVGICEQPVPDLVRELVRPSVCDEQVEHDEQVVAGSTAKAAPDDNIDATADAETIVVAVPAGAKTDAHKDPIIHTEFLKDRNVRDPNSGITMSQIRLSFLIKANLMLLFLWL